VARLPVSTTSTTTTAAPTTATNQALAQALSKLLRSNGTHINVAVKPPFAFNASIRTDTLKMAGQLVQQLGQVQPVMNALLQLLPKASSTQARALLEDDEATDPLDTTSIQTMTATTASTTTKTPQKSQTLRRLQPASMSSCQTPGW
jgi:hypothetical protein